MQTAQDEYVVIAHYTNYMQYLLLCLENFHFDS